MLPIYVPFPGGRGGGGWRPEEAVDSWIVPLYFHMPTKKDGVSGIISRRLHCAEERRKWRSKRELVQQQRGGELGPPPNRGCISVLLSLPKWLHVLLCEPLLCAEGHPRGTLPSLKVMARAWLEAGLI